VEIAGSGERPRSERKSGGAKPCSAWPVNCHDEIWYGRRAEWDGSWKVAARGKVGRIAHGSRHLARSDGAAAQPPAFQRIEQASSFERPCRRKRAERRRPCRAPWSQVALGVSTSRQFAGPHDRGPRRGSRALMPRRMDGGDAPRGALLRRAGCRVARRNVLYDRAESAISRVTPGSIDWAPIFAGARWYHVAGSRGIERRRGQSHRPSRSLWRSRPVSQ